jgi:ubiquinone/menaquinone biosynthesis C-methylase UbiE
VARLGPDRREGYIEMPVVQGYDTWAATYDSDPNPLIALEQRETLGFIGGVRGQRVLDLGCGTGRYCALLAERGAEVVGIDASDEMLARAREKLSSTRHFELRQGMIEQVTFPSDSFDLVLCALTLGHLPGLGSIFGHVSRMLRPGGRMVISDVHPFWPVSGHDYTEFFDDAGQEYRIAVYPHLMEEYWTLCQQAGLRLQDIREPRIEDWLIERFPSLAEFRHIPLAIVLKFGKPTVGAQDGCYG